MPLIPAIVAVALMWLLYYSRTGERRASFLYAALQFGVSLVVVTEALSAANLLTPRSVSVAWTLISIALALLYLRVEKIHPLRLPEPAEDVTFAWKLLFVMTAGLLIVIGITAFVAAPNTWDSMQYHLPRVVEWAMHKNVRFYPTRDYQQLFAPPFAAFAMLEDYLLLGGDMATGSVQWLAWVGCAIAASLIARSLGAKPRGQLLAFIVCATIPNGVLSASGTKDDCVVAFWIAVTIYFLFQYQRRQSWASAVAIGAALGLSILTKGTAYFYLPCFFLVALLPLFHVPIPRKLLLQSGLILLCAMAINAPQFVRNRDLSGSILGFSSPDGEGQFPWRNKTLSFSGTVSNVFRNLLCHFGARNPALNKELINRSRALLVRFGIDPDDPSTTWTHDRFTIYPFGRHEIFAGNPLQIVLFIVSLLAVLVDRSRLPRGNILYAFAIIGSFVLFCLLLRYQSWNARLHLPLLVLASCTIAIAASHYAPKSIQAGLALVLLLLAIPNAICNDLRPIVTRPGLNRSIFETPREKVYFYDQHQSLEPSYRAAADAVKRAGCQTAGIDASQEHFEYPLFALLHNRHVDQIVYSGVANRSSRYSANQPPGAPCAVICPACARAPSRTAVYMSKGDRAQRFGDVEVFFPSGHGKTLMRYLN